MRQVLDGSAVIVKVRAPDASQTPRAGGVLVSLGGRDAGLAKRLQEQPVSHLALERVPRISRAQAMGLGWLIVSPNEAWVFAAMLAIAVLVGILDLFVEPKTSMLFGDARQSLLDLGLQVKGA